MLCMSLRNYERQSKKLTKLIAPFPDADDIYFRLFIHEEHHIWGQVLQCHMGERNDC